ncbi:MAG: ATP-binding protein [Kiritimatiellae bacterium]|nr:ATP-binding protein [Kiritimatiellia bacterium]
MSLIGSIQSGRRPSPPRLMVYGAEGVGKSSFAAKAPKAVFIQTEDGLSEIECSRFPIAGSFEEFLLQLKAVRDEEHGFRTLCIDSLDWLERLIWDRVCSDFGVKCIEKADGGYGKGYTHALTYWRQAVSILNEIRSRRGMAVILIAHSKVERFEDPEHASYDRYTPRLHKVACSLVCEWVDAVLFATRRMRVDSTTGKAAPIGADGGERILRTNGSPACIAKNRFGLPAEIALDWDAFVAGLSTKTQNIK